MTTDNETKAVEKYVLLDSEKWKTAGVVYESWAGIRNKVCKEFLQRLCSAIEQKARANSNLEKFADDRKIEHSYDGERKYKNWLCLYRNCWAQYEQGDRSISDGRTVIVLQNDERGPNGWCIGVSSPIAEDKMEPEEKERRLRLNKELNGIPPSNEGPDSLLAMVELGRRGQKELGFTGPGIAPGKRGQRRENHELLCRQVH